MIFDLEGEPNFEVTVEDGEEEEEGEEEGGEGVEEEGEQKDEGEDKEGAGVVVHGAGGKGGIRGSRATEGAVV